MSDGILEFIKACEKWVGGTLKIKRSKYEVFDYDFNLGFLLKKISGKKDKSVIPVSPITLVKAIKSGEAEILSLKEEQ